MKCYTETPLGVTVTLAETQWLRDVIKANACILSSTETTSRSGFIKEDGGNCNYSVHDAESDHKFYPPNGLFVV